MEKEVIIFKGKEKGLVSVILAGNHGNELCGVKAFKEIIPDLHIDAGTVYFLIGNINAISLNIRFTESNLNRMFKPENCLSYEEKYSYEYFRSQYLKQYLDIASALLDIHSSSTAGSPPFVICEENAFTIAKELPVKTIVYGFANANPGGAYSYMNSQGGIGVAIECGQHDDLVSKDIAKQAIFSFIELRGHKKSKKLNQKGNKDFFEAYLIYKSKTNSFKRKKMFRDFEKVAKGQIIGIDGNTNVYTQEDSIILFAIDSEQSGDEVFVLGRNLNFNFSTNKI